MLVPERLGQVRLQVGGGRPDPCDDGRIVRERVEPLHAQQPEQGCRVLLAEGPEPRVERTEKLPGGGVPRPAQVQREGVEWGERLGQHGSDGESADGLHAGQSRGPVLAFRELAATGGRVATHLRRTPGGRCSANIPHRPVSYTHLTLPTIY